MDMNVLKNKNELNSIKSWAECEILKPNKLKRYTLAPSGAVQHHRQPLMKTEYSLSMWWIAFLWELSLSSCPFLPSVSHQLGLLLSHPAIMS